MSIQSKAFLCSALLSVLISGTAGCQQRTYELPPNWPIQQLTLPSGAKLTSPAEVDFNSAGGRIDRRISIAQFTTAGPWTAAASHVEQCLGPLSYVEHVIVYPDGSTSQDQLRDYWSPDEKVEVELAPMAAGKTPAVVLRITEYSQPQPVLSSHGSVTSRGVRTEIRPL